MLHGTSLMTHYIVSYVRDKKTARDMVMEEHPNILATNLMRNTKTPCRLKRRLLQDPTPNRILINSTTGHMLFKTFLNYHVYY